MFTSSLSKINNILLKGDARTVLAKKNILGSLGLKVLDTAIDFLLVPLSLAYLTQTDYGIWLTINSMVNWLNFFDIGISHGYRNKLAIALSEKNFLQAKIYTSTAYGVISIISLIIALCGVLVFPFLNWSFILNIEASYNSVISLIMITVIVTFSLRLTFKIITSVFLANQMPFLNNLINTFIKVFSLIGVGLVILFSTNNLLLYAVIMSLVPLLILLASSLFYFKKKYSQFRPSFKYFRKDKINDLMGLGLKFFVIQMAATMLFMTDNLIISHIISPAAVTPFQITNKYFSVVLILFSIIIAPFWSAITEAYSKKEYDWIRQSIAKLNKIWGLGVILSIILLALFYPVLSIWLGDKITVPFILTLQWTIFVILQTYNNIYTYFLNGIGKVYLQMLTGILSLVINIPLSIFFAKYLQLGTAGVLLATNCSIVIYIITRKIQYNRIINNNATGIWSK